MKKIVLVTMATLLAFVSNVNAQEGTMSDGNYFQVDVMMLSMDIETSLPSSIFSPSTANPMAIRGTYGKVVSENMAVEGVFAIGLGDDSAGTYHDVIDVDIATELKTMFGVYMRGRTSLSSGTDVYAKVGFVQADIDLTASAYGSSSSDSYDDSGIAFGLGVSFALNQAGAIAIEYNKLPDIDIGDGDKISMSSISVGYKMDL